ncbi:hypothetical protein C5F44_11260 [Fuscovulum blasticum DSM 2131]|uniref:Glycosyltransferase 2-like domain-containing protein n=1 Tax=Fuscovulum blasticum DSM 2131 TaxID=1188250 RepID=A0A2T4J7M2_FUSBL|nr:hypothetical protein C5F44_11260 [Fuscovulum blasticum DSM 2131]
MPGISSSVAGAGTCPVEATDIVSTSDRLSPTASASRPPPARVAEYSISRPPCSHSSRSSTPDSRLAGAPRKVSIVWKEYTRGPRHMVPPRRLAAKPGDGAGKAGRNPGVSAQFRSKLAKDLTFPRHNRHTPQAGALPLPPHVTIVMATRNGARHLPAQLASLARQTHPDWALFVSDDASTDATPAILAGFARRHPLHLVPGPCTGTAAANFLSALGHPDLPAGPVALADQDDVWLPGKLSRALRRLGPDPAPALYAAESLLCDAALRPLRRSRPPRAVPGFGNALAQNLFCGHTLVLNAAALALVRQALALLGPQGARAIPWHDWWIYQLLAGAGARLVLDPLPVALYRQHPGNALGGSGDLRGALRRLALLGSGRWGWAMQAQAQALQQTAALLTPAARRTLDGFLAAPPAGPGRAMALHRAGLHRASASGTAVLLAAAALGRV